MKLYKLTERDNTTYYGKMKWEVGKSNKVKKCKDPQLCSSDVIHAYKNKNLALLLNPIHADIKSFNFYECFGDIVVEDFGKCGVFKLDVIKKLKNPIWYTDINIRKKVIVCFAILCAESVFIYYDEFYQNDNRVKNAINEAKKYINVAHAAAAAHAAADAAATAAHATAAHAAAAAVAATHATYAAAEINNSIDFCKLADKAVKIIKNKEII